MGIESRELEFGSLFGCEIEFDLGIKKTMSNTSKRLFLLTKISAGIFLGGFFLPAFLPNLNSFSGFLVRIFLTIVVIAILNPTDEGNAWQLKALRESSYYLLHPIQWPTFVGILWFVLSCLTVYFMNVNGVTAAFFIFLPVFFFWGLSGFYMFQRDEFFSTSRGHVRGFPAKLYGAVITITFWGIAILFAASIIFHWK